MTRSRYLLRRAGMDRYADAVNPFNGLSWPIRLRLALIVPWRSGWNARVRDWTARREGHVSYEDETTRPAFTVAYNEIGNPRPERVCDCWLLPTLPPHQPGCEFHVPPPLTPDDDEKPARLGINTDAGTMSIADFVREGAHVDAEGNTRRGRSDGCQERFLARLVRDLVAAGCRSSTDHRCPACDELDVHADGCPWRHAADWLERYENEAVVRINRDYEGETTTP